MTLDIHAAADIPFYQGPHELEGLRFRHARQTLGVSAWGMNILDFDPHCANYPEHDHAADGQEEVYVVLEGTVYVQSEGTEARLDAGDLIRFAPEVSRKLVTRDAPARVLALGATPGKVYTPNPGM